jgi:hypothetical protein
MGIRQECHHQSHGGDIKTVIAEGKGLCIADLEVDRLCSRSRSRKGELAFRWIEGDDFAGSAASSKRFGESSVTATHVEPSEIRWNVEPIQENLAGEAAPATHKSLVGFAIVK